MARARLGVALLVPEPVAAEIDGLRRSLGDGSLGRIPAHLTLVPPVNVALDRLDDAASLLRTAAAAVAPLELTLGPPVTFWPVNPVIYLSVGGDVDGVNALRDGVFREPLARPLTYDFVPHVTLADEVVSPARIESALAAMADYRRTVRFERVHILREGPGRVWEPVVDAQLGRASVVGRGGLPLTLSLAGATDEAALARAGRPAPLVVVARREGSVVGVAEARLGAGAGAGAGAGVGAAWLTELSVADADCNTGVGSALLAELVSRLAQRGVARLRVGRDSMPAPVTEFLRHRGFAPGPDGTLGRGL